MGAGEENAPVSCRGGEAFWVSFIPHAAGKVRALAAGTSETRPRAGFPPSFLGPGSRKPPASHPPFRLCKWQQTSGKGLACKTPLWGETVNLKAQPSNWAEREISEGAHGKGPPGSPKGSQARFSRTNGPARRAAVCAGGGESESVRN